MKQTRFTKEQIIVALGVFLSVTSRPVGAQGLETARSPVFLSAGSETMEDLMTAWAAAFAKEQPGIELQVEARGSATGYVALVEGRSQLAPMSRAMTRQELDLFEERRGHRPVPIRVAYDAVAVCVHRENPLRGLTLAQLDGIFSADQECGGGPIREWGTLIYGPLARRPIRPVGREQFSGTHDYFRDRVLCGGHFRGDVREERDSESVIRAVASDPTAIGYAGADYGASGVHTVALALNDEGPYVLPILEVADQDHHKTYANVVSGRYPLSRPFYIYIDKQPGERLPDHVDAFMQMVLSPGGQEIVARVGFVPLPQSMLEKERLKLEADYAPSLWSEWLNWILKREP